ncbi:MAG: DUF3795 domain-containing protein [Abditibacteriota bacterium]|nr:DUF3795 domain-containing protein [Abditibacteriota bacterium]
MKQLIGVCGLDCEKCDAYIATKNNDEELRKKTAEKWSQMNGVEILSEYLHCQGCRTEGVKTFYCESMCEIRKCARSKGFETCGECAEAEGCGTLGYIVSGNPDALKNLK